VAAVFVILILIIATTPVLAIMNGVIAAGFLLAMAAVAIALIVLTLPAGEFRRLGTLWKPLALVALIPGIWMLVQIAPVPGWLGHSAWTSASVALAEPLAGTITLDIGETLLGLGRYSLALAVAIVATAVALDRQRAQIILFVLTAAAALIAITSIAAGLIGLEPRSLRFAEMNFSVDRPQMLTIAVMGLVLSCAMILSAYEAYRSHRMTGRPAILTTIAMTASIAAAVICLSAIAMDADAALLLAAALGVFTLMALVFIRRSRLGPWGQSGIAATALLGLIGFFAAGPANRAVDLTLVLSSQRQASIATAERMLSDAKWAGTGAGTFAALFPIYRDIGDAGLVAPPTAAASIAIEMGRPLLWSLVILVLLGALLLFRRALKRNREYLYAGAGAACMMAVLVASFANAGILGLGASLLASAVCGLALAQSRSWSV
jgi:hypothetical protein